MKHTATRARAAARRLHGGLHGAPCALALTLGALSCALYLVLSPLPRVAGRSWPCSTTCRALVSSCLFTRPCTAWIPCCRVRLPGLSMGGTTVLLPRALTWRIHGRCSPGVFMGGTTDLAIFGLDFHTLAVLLLPVLALDGYAATTCSYSVTTVGGRTVSTILD